MLHQTIRIHVKYDSGDGQEFSQKYTVVTPKKGEKYGAASKMGVALCRSREG